MRLFIAIELPDEVKAALASVQTRLQEGKPPVKWVALHAMHLTLQFLGETDAALLPHIGAAMERALARRAALTLRLDGVGAFPNARRPNVLWAGVGGATTALVQMQATLAAALEPLGFARESRPFHAHLTLGRVRREATVVQQAQLGIALGALELPPLEWTVARVVLFQSELQPTGPVYSERYNVALRGEE